VYRLGLNAGMLAAAMRPESRVPVYVIPTDEELMIARHTLSLLARGAATQTQHARA